MRDTAKAGAQRRISDYFRSGDGQKSKFSQTGHRRRTSGKEIFKCYICGKIYKTEMCLRTHQHTHTEFLSPLPYQIPKCSICQLQFSQQRKYERHMQAKHSKEYKSWCHMCYKICESIDELESHYRSHENSNPHSCQLCSKSFSSLTKLKCHSLQSHSTIRKHRCSSCIFSYVVSCGKKGCKDSLSGNCPEYTCPFCRCETAASNCDKRVSSKEKEASTDNVKRTSRPKRISSKSSEVYSENKNHEARAQRERTWISDKSDTSSTTLTTESEASDLEEFNKGTVNNAGRSSPRKKTRISTKSKLSNSCGEECDSDASFGKLTTESKARDLEESNKKKLNFKWLGPGSRKGRKTNTRLRQQKLPKTGFKCRCDLCGQMFTAWRDLAKHKQLHPEFTSSLPYKFYQCTECYFVCASQITFGKHVKRQHSILMCVVCLEVCENLEELLSHDANHAGDIITFPCSLCKRTFSSDSLFYKHLRVFHSKVRHHLCRCGYIYKVACGEKYCPATEKRLCQAYTCPFCVKKYGGRSSIETNDNYCSARTTSAFREKSPQEKKRKVERKIEDRNHIDLSCIQESQANQDESCAFTGSAGSAAFSNSDVSKSTSQVELETETCAALPESISEKTRMKDKTSLIANQVSESEARKRPAKSEESHQVYSKSTKKYLTSKKAKTRRCSNDKGSSSDETDNDSSDTNLRIADLRRRAERKYVHKGICVGKYDYNSGGSNKVYRCDLCGEIFNQAVYLRTHKRLHPEFALSLPYDVHQCTRCGFTCATLDVLKRHMKEGHSLLYCVVCHEVCDSSEQLLWHENNHSYNIFPCHLCRKKFHIEKALRIHLLKKHSKIRYHHCRCNYVYHVACEDGGDCVALRKRKCNAYTCPFCLNDDRNNLLHQHCESLVNNDNTGTVSLNSVSMEENPGTKERIHEQKVEDGNSESIPEGKDICVLNIGIDKASEVEPVEDVTGNTSISHHLSEKKRTRSLSQSEEEDILHEASAKVVSPSKSYPDAKLFSIDTEHGGCENENSTSQTENEIIPSKVEDVQSRSVKHVNDLDTSQTGEKKNKHETESSKIDDDQDESIEEEYHISQSEASEAEYDDIVDCHSDSLNGITDQIASKQVPKSSYSTMEIQSTESFVPKSIEEVNKVFSSVCCTPDALKIKKARKKSKYTHEQTEKQNRSGEDVLLRSNNSQIRNINTLENVECHDENDEKQKEYHDDISCLSDTSQSSASKKKCRNRKYNEIKDFSSSNDSSEGSVISLTKKKKQNDTEVGLSSSSDSSQSSPIRLTSKKEQNDTEVDFSSSNDSSQSSPIRLTSKKEQNDTEVDFSSSNDSSQSSPIRLTSKKEQNDTEVDFSSSSDSSESSPIKVTSTKKYYYEKQNEAKNDFSSASDSFQSSSIMVTSKKKLHYEKHCEAEKYFSSSNDSSQSSPIKLTPKKKLFYEKQDEVEKGFSSSSDSSQSSSIKETSKEKKHRHDSNEQNNDFDDFLFASNASQTSKINKKKKKREYNGDEVFNDVNEIPNLSEMNFSSVNNTSEMLKLEEHKQPVLNVNNDDTHDLSDVRSTDGTHTYQISKLKNKKDDVLTEDVENWNQPEVDFLYDSDTSETLKVKQEKRHHSKVEKEVLHHDDKVLNEDKKWNQSEVDVPYVIDISQTSKGKKKKKHHPKNEDNQKKDQSEMDFSWVNDIFKSSKMKKRQRHDNEILNEGNEKRKQSEVDFSCVGSRPCKMANKEHENEIFIEDNEKQDKSEVDFPCVSDISRTCKMKKKEHENEVFIEDNEEQNQSEVDFSCVSNISKTYKMKKKTQQKNEDNEKQNQSEVDFACVSDISKTSKMKKKKRHENEGLNKDDEKQNQPEMDLSYVSDISKTFKMKKKKRHHENEDNEKQNQSEVDFACVSHISKTSKMKKKKRHYENEDNEKQNQSEVDFVCVSHISKTSKMKKNKRHENEDLNKDDEKQNQSEMDLSYVRDSSKTSKMKKKKRHLENEDNEKQNRSEVDFACVSDISETSKMKKKKRRENEDLNKDEKQNQPEMDLSYVSDIPKTSKMKKKKRHHENEENEKQNQSEVNFSWVNDLFKTSKMKGKQYHENETFSEDNEEQNQSEVEFSCSIDILKTSKTKKKKHHHENEVLNNGNKKNNQSEEDFPYVNGTSQTSKVKKHKRHNEKVLNKEREKHDQSEVSLSYVNDISKVKKKKKHYDKDYQSEMDSTYVNATPVFSKIQKEKQHEEEGFNKDDEKHNQTKMDFSCISDTSPTSKTKKKNEDHSRGDVLNEGCEKLNQSADFSYVSDTLKATPRKQLTDDISQQSKLKKKKKDKYHQEEAWNVENEELNHSEADLSRISCKSLSLDERNINGPFYRNAEVLIKSSSDEEENEHYEGQDNNALSLQIKKNKCHADDESLDENESHLDFSFRSYTAQNFKSEKERMRERDVDCRLERLNRKDAKPTEHDAEGGTSRYLKKIEKDGKFCHPDVAISGSESMNKLPSGCDFSQNGNKNFNCDEIENEMWEGSSSNFDISKNRKRKKRENARETLENINENMNIFNIDKVTSCVGDDSEFSHDLKKRKRKEMKEPHQHHSKKQRLTHNYYSERNSFTGTDSPSECPIPRVANEADGKHSNQLNYETDQKRNEILTDLSEALQSTPIIKRKSPKKKWARKGETSSLLERNDVECTVVDTFNSPQNTGESSYSCTGGDLVVSIPSSSTQRPGIDNGAVSSHRARVSSVIEGLDTSSFIEDIFSADESFAQDKSRNVFMKVKRKVTKKRIWHDGGAGESLVIKATIPIITKSSSDTTTRRSSIKETSWQDSSSEWIHRLFQKHS